MLLKPLTPQGLGAIAYANYSESAATMVRVEALHAAAKLQQAAARDGGHYAELGTQLGAYLPGLRDVWLALLRDHATLQTQPRGVQRAYRPHLYTTSAAAAARAQMERAWPAVLGAVVAAVGTEAWMHGRDGALSAAPAGMPEGGADGAPQPIVPRPHGEDFALLLGLCVHRLAEEVDAPADGAAPADEVLGCVSALKGLLLPGTYLAPAALPPQSLLALLQLLQGVTAAPACAPAVREAAAQLAAHVCAHLGPYVQGGGGFAPPPLAAELLAALQRLCAAPALRAYPHLAQPQQLATPSGMAPPPPLAPEDMPLVRLAVRAGATLPAALAQPAERLPWLPTPLLLTLYVAHAAAASGAAELSAEALQATRALVALAPADGAVPAWAALLVSASETALALAEATPAAQRLPLLQLLLELAGALPEGDAAAAVQAKAVGAVRAMLGGELPAQKAALQALQGLLSAAAAPSVAPSVAGCARVFVGALAPEVAPLLLKTAPAEAADKAGAMKVLLLACSIAPPEAMPTLLSLALPLMIGCMWVASEGAADAAALELSKLAHASVTALAKRATTEFKQAVAVFDPATKSRMETAIRDSATAAQPGATAGTPGRAATTPAKPTIALKMDFSGFGKK